LDNLISPEYQKLLEEQHTKFPEWARSGSKFKGRIFALIDSIVPSTIIDYGCGKGVLAQEIFNAYKIKVDKYDPAIPEFSARPTPAMLLICTDVLEHIEEDKIDDVMKHIAGLFLKASYFIVHTGDCGHRLADGRPAHILQRSQEWWEQKFKEHLTDCDFQFKDTRLPLRFEVIALRRKRLCN
jgi:hypothetical protein